jgi:ergothioneine biosynthesis protein EgtB
MDMLMMKTEWLDPPAHTASERIRRLAERYQRVRGLSEQIARPLSAEDCAIQTMPDVSPTRWHLAHTTWFFETFLLSAVPGYKPFDASFETLFNSYYNSIGDPFPRDRRGQISRPGLLDTLVYRRHVDDWMLEWFSRSEHGPQELETLLIGINHEQQHQELMLTDIKHVLSCNPLEPVYCPEKVTDAEAAELQWIPFDEALVWIGHGRLDSVADTFAFDNEQPRHRHFLESYSLGSRCVTNREYRQFMKDGGYQRPELWLSLGWDAVRSNGWSAPLYWSQVDGQWSQFTLAGRKPISPEEPVCHVSYFEADAFARWAGCRLPTEQEWENAVASDIANSQPTTANHDSPGHWSDVLLDAGNSIHPRVETDDELESRFANLRLRNALGNLWEWTASQYTAYPGYQPPSGALGEYNGKFMCNQFVLRGGSCATPAGHLRITYRNFFPPDARWQFSGIRLAKS